MSHFRYWIQFDFIQTWTSVEICQIVIVFCLYCIRSLHSPCPIAWACNNYLHLLTNWNPSKSFICGGVWGCKNRCMPLTTRVHSKSSFNMGVFKFARLSPRSIGYLNATQKLHFLVHAFKVDQKYHVRTFQKIQHTKGLLWMSCKKILITWSKQRNLHMVIL